MINKIKTGLLIPVFNGLSFTSNCLTRLYGLHSNSDASGLDLQIIVIDDGSTDGTSEWIHINFPQTHVLTGDGSLWWSGGINLGMKFAIDQLECDYLLWWNNDISPADDYFVHLEQILKSSKPEICGSKIYYAHDPEMVWSMGGIFDTRNGRKHMTGMNVKDNQDLDKIYSADWLPGMGTLLHKSVIEKTGFLDEKNFPQYHGDSDYTYRATLAGYCIKVYPQLKIWNDKSNSGLLHQDNFKLLKKSLKDIKSNYHFGKDLLFYRKYATSAFAYQTLAVKYCLYIGGFAKWKFLNLLGIRKKQKSF